MNSFILIPYYNKIPVKSTSYFNISNSSLIISLDDIAGTSTSFLIKNINKLIYIFNGPNMGSFVPLSYTQTATQYEIVIKLNSIPINLVDNTMCVLSTIPSVYNISRTYINPGNELTSGNFTLVDNSNIEISIKSSLNVDNTLFLYILATINEFNILVNNSTIFKVKGVKLQVPPPDSNSIIFTADIPMMPLINGESYTIFISTQNSSTISNVNLNGTFINPIQSSVINMIPPSTSNVIGSIFTPSGLAPLIKTNTMVVTPVIMNQPPIIPDNNVNKPSSNKIPYNNNVVLLYQPPNLHTDSGSFSIETSVNPSIQDSSADIFTHFEHMTGTIPKISNTPYSRGKELINVISNNPIAKSIYNAAKNLVSVNPNLPINPDLITNIPIIEGTTCTLHLSTSDIFQQPVNFIEQHSLLFLSNGKSTTVLSTNTIPSSQENSEDDIIQCNVILNSPLPILNINTPYVLSITPIMPYIKCKYESSYNQANVIGAGLFGIIPVSSSIKNPTMTISNYDLISGINNSSFTNLLYTLINTPNTLNILNGDYSFACSLAILNVQSTRDQTIFTYGITSGSLYNISNTTNYIFTLLSASEIINNIELANKNKRKNHFIHSLLLNAISNINDSLTSNTSNIALLNSKNLLHNALIQSETLINMPFSANSNIISTSILTLLYNSITSGLIGSPNNVNLQSLLITINKLASPIITLALLKNAQIYINVSLKENPSDELVINASNSVDDAIMKINIKNSSTTLFNTPSYSTPSSVDLLTNVVNTLAIANNNLPDDKNLRKAQIILAGSFSPSSTIYTKVVPNNPQTISQPIFSSANIQPESQDAEPESQYIEAPSQTLFGSIYANTSPSTYIWTPTKHNSNMGYGLLIFIVLTIVVGGGLTYYMNSQDSLPSPIYESGSRYQKYDLGYNGESDMDLSDRDLGESDLGESDLGKSDAETENIYSEYNQNKSKPNHIIIYGVIAVVVIIIICIVVNMLPSSSSTPSGNINNNSNISSNSTTYVSSNDNDDPIITSTKKSSNNNSNIGQNNNIRGENVGEEIA